MPLTALAIIIADGNPARALTALSLAAAAAALGRDVALLFDQASVGLLHDPSLADAFATAQDLGARLTVCATGLADRGTLLPEGIAAGGMVAFLADNAHAQLLIV